jgi:hypothetical protein
MKVLSHEATVLTGGYRDQVAGKKRRYSDTLMEILGEIRKSDDSHLRAATFGLFGMMNWVYTWYRPGRDLPVEELVEETLRLFLRGFLSCRDLPEESAVSGEQLGGMPSIWRAT